VSSLFGWCQSRQHDACRGRAGTNLVCSCPCHGREVSQDDRLVVDIELPEEEDCSPGALRDAWEHLEEIWDDHFADAQRAVEDLLDL
jgi:hypothetical protein